MPQCDEKAGCELQEIELKRNGAQMGCSKAQGDKKSVTDCKDKVPRARYDLYGRAYNLMFEFQIELLNLSFPERSPILLAEYMPTGFMDTKGSCSGVPKES
jgi:hypothetical protein